MTKEELKILLRDFRNMQAQLNYLKELSNDQTISQTTFHEKERMLRLIESALTVLDKRVFFASTFSSKMQIDFLKVAWGISPVLHFPLRHSFRCRRGAVAGIQSLLVTDM